MIGGASRPTKTLMYVAKIIIIKIEVRKTIPALRVRFKTARTTARSNRVEVSPNSDKLAIIISRASFLCNDLIVDKTRSSRPEVAPIVTNTERVTNIDISNKKHGDRTVIHSTYPTDLLDNRRCDTA